MSLGLVHCSIIDLHLLNFQDIKIANITILIIAYVKYKFTQEYKSLYSYCRIWVHNEFTQPNQIDFHNGFSSYMPLILEILIKLALFLISGVVKHIRSLNQLISQYASTCMKIKHTSFIKTFVHSELWFLKIINCCITNIYCTNIAILQEVHGKNALLIFSPT